ncbi:oxygen-insensitive NADPH nitroreductase [Brevibacillus migulae]|uniref:oxygen-insensitive NADPH nitroreductase n=1 Tax=Brevibacillus migulae TaxID=1644114 RepID=UPI00106EF5D1|nr:oxygen-insensitive NADPH nitroreductase [Brevibacillus migulae]
MNQVIDTILSHRSVRKFEDKPLTNEQIEQIIRSAQAASTSSFIQAYSIIGVTDAAKKARLAELAGNQTYVAQNGHFLIFCADLYRHEIIGELEEKEVLDSIESTEKFMVAIIDAALAAQNAAIAAESMGLGICYIGGIRNQLEEVKKLLHTPERVLPLFGMAIGYPLENNETKPRLPLHHVYHENQYQDNKDEYIRQLNSYNDTVSRYYEQRTAGKRRDRWTEQMASMLEKKSRMYMKEFVQQNKMDLK